MLRAGVCFRVIYVHVCACELLNVPQGTPGLSGDLMWLMSGLIITTPPHPTTLHPDTSAAACPAQTPSAVPRPSREYYTFTLYFMVVTLIADEVFVVFHRTLSVPLPEPQVHYG